MTCLPHGKCSGINLMVEFVIWFLFSVQTPVHKSPFSHFKVLEPDGLFVFELRSTEVDNMMTK